MEQSIGTCVSQREGEFDLGKKLIKKFEMIIAVVFLLCSPGLTVHAAEAAAIVETNTGEDSITVYVKGASADITDVAVQIGTATGDITKTWKVSEGEIPMQTLVMIDNSKSITKANRAKITDFLQNLISDRSENEEIAIATFGEELTLLTEYTSEYNTLKKAIDTITYQKRGTYLTDVLYDLISAEYLSDNENVFRRMIVVSDGMDNKSLGYTKEELYALLKESCFPIYTIGCINGENNERLENMFALSRKTKADSFLMDEVEDTLDICGSLNSDRDVVGIRIAPAPENMDGTRKAVKISFADSGNQTSLSTDIVMPQQTQVKEEQEPEAETQAKEEQGPEAETQAVVESLPEDSVKSDRSIVIPVIVVIAMIVVVVIAAVITVILLKKKKGKKQFEPADEDTLNEHISGSKAYEEKTEYVGEAADDDDDDRTYVIWNNESTYHIILTDMNAMARRFQVPLEHSVVVGRKAGVCDIVLDYERSVSGRHCEISVRDGRFYLKDLQSANGTFVNGSKVLAETEIYSGSMIKLGRLEMKFEVRE